MYDDKNGEEIVLSAADITMIRRMQRAKPALPYRDEASAARGRARCRTLAYRDGWWWCVCVCVCVCVCLCGGGRQDYTLVDTSPPEIHPLGGVDEPKRRFLPSKWERMKVRAACVRAAPAAVVTTAAAAAGAVFTRTRR